MNSMLAYGRFELRRTLRNHVLILSSVLLPGLLYATNGQVRNAPIIGIEWSAYFLASMVCFAAISAAIRVGPSVSAERATGWLNQLRLTCLSPSEYIGAKVATATLVSIGPAALLLIEGIAFGATGIRSAPVLTGVIFFGSIPFAGVGLIIGFLITPRALQVVTTSVTMGLSVLGGLFVPDPALPAAVRVVERLLPSDHFARVARAAIAHRSLPSLPVAALVLDSVIAFALVAWLYRHDQRGAAAGY